MGARPGAAGVTDRGCRSVMRASTSRRIVAVVGAVALGALLLTIVRDVQRLDPTSGGYSPPYDDFRGEPIDWSAQTATAEGFRATTGTLLNASLDCTTGRLTLHVGPVSVEYRELSPRAIAVHKPHVACAGRGFVPEWELPATDLQPGDPAMSG